MIDTENKRRSVLGVSGAIVYPRASGTVDAPAREQSAWLYAGIPAGTAPAAPDHVPQSGLMLGVRISAV